MQFMKLFTLVSGLSGACLIDLAPIRAQDSESPLFALGLAPCDAVIERSPGAAYAMSFDLALTTTGAVSHGAQGWSLSIAGEGCRFTSITTVGTASDLTTADPPGLRINGFEKSEVAFGGGKGRCATGTGAVSAVVLSFVDVVTLPPVGTAIVARTTVAGTAPGSPAERSPVSVFYFDGCSGSGGPISNAVTWMGATHTPTVSRCDFEVVATPGVFRRGDANADGKVDLSDAVMILGCKFLGEKCPGCRDAGDANDDGLMDLSDAVYLLGFLFLGGPPPLPPAGAGVCGLDPTADELPSCVHAGC